METSLSKKSDPFRVIMAILIASVTLFGAVVVWRAALATDEAGDDDFAGLSATLNAEKTRVLNKATMYEHYRSYTTYLHHNELGNLMAADREALTGAELANLDRQKTEAWDMAIVNQDFFDSRYLEPDGSYNTQRELGEAWAEAGLEEDLNPAPHFGGADRMRNKSCWFIASLIVLAISLVFYTLAEGLNPGLKLLRYSLAFIGLVSMLLGGLAAVIVELT